MKTIELSKAEYEALWKRVAANGRFDSVGYNAAAMTDFELGTGDKYRMEYLRQYEREPMEVIWHGDGETVRYVRKIR